MGTNCDEAKVNQMITEADFEGDNRVSFEEFLKMMGNNEEVEAKVLSPAKGTMDDELASRKLAEERYEYSTVHF